MPRVGTTRRDSSSMLARRRVFAIAAVAGCLVADVVGVAVAANRADASGGSTFTEMASVSFTAGTTFTPSATNTAAASGGASSSVDSAETIPAPAPSATTVAPKPATTTVVKRGTGRFAVVTVPAGSVKLTPTTGREVRYTVEMEGGLGVQAGPYAAAVFADLTDARGWQTRDQVRFVNVTPAQAAAGTKPDLRITLASPDTTDRLCAPLQTRGQVSCHNGGRVVLNARRWLLGADAYGKDVRTYRIYLVNHEVGHGIGHGHVQCGGKGQPAPVMMQQTYGLDGCGAWPWPTAKPA